MALAAAAALFAAGAYVHDGHKTFERDLAAMNAALLAAAGASVVASLAQPPERCAD